MRNYFAVAECDGLETASVLYGELDGLEMEHSSVVLDMRYIPDDVDLKINAILLGQTMSLLTSLLLRCSGLTSIAPGRTATKKERGRS